MTDTTRRRSWTRLISEVLFWQTHSAPRLRHAIQSSPIHWIVPLSFSLGDIVGPPVPPSATVLLFNELETTSPIWRVTWKLVEPCFHGVTLSTAVSLGGFERYNFRISSSSPALKYLCYLTDD